MKRAIASLALFGAAMLGLTGCSGSPDAAPETVSEAVPTQSQAAAETATTERPTDDEAPAVDMSMANACLSLTEPLNQANTAMLALAQDTTNDPQNAVDLWRALAVAFEDFGSTAANSEVADLAAAVGSDGHALADEMQKVFVDQDITQMSAYTEASDNFFESYEEILTLCNTAG